MKIVLEFILLKKLYIQMVSETPSKKFLKIFKKILEKCKEHVDQELVNLKYQNNIHNVFFDLNIQIHSNILHIQEDIGICNKIYEDIQKMLTELEKLLQKPKRRKE